MNILYTVGYWQIGKPEKLRAWVESHDAILLDIRMSPRSQNPTWSGGSLRAMFGARYQHIPALGNKNYNNGQPIALANPMAGLEAVKVHLVAHPVVLMCACKDVHTCHRKVAAEYLHEQTGATVYHLSAADFVDKSPVAPAPPEPKPHQPAKPDKPVQLKLF